jgi:integrase
VSLPTPLKAHGGYWSTMWRDVSGKKRMKRFGSATRVRKAAALNDYEQWLKQWHTDEAVRNPGAAPLTVNVLADRYQAFADMYYQRNGKPTGEAVNVRHAIGHLRDHCGALAADQVTPTVIKSMREKMIEAKRPSGRPLYCRPTIDKRLSKIRRMFKWAAGEELVSASVWHALQAVEPLKPGRTAAPETEPVKPAPQRHIDAVLPLVPRPVAAMIRLQLLTGMRPGEVCIMRACDLDMSESQWVYRPSEHKTQHHGKDRRIPLGPQAQAIIREYLTRDVTAHLFRSSHHKATLAHYTRDAYYQAVMRACRRAKVRQWSPGQLRHNAATAIRQRYGLEAAKVILGHSKIETTQVYAEADFDKARKIMGEVG